MELIHFCQHFIFLTMLELHPTASKKLSLYYLVLIYCLIDCTSLKIVIVHPNRLAIGSYLIFILHAWFKL